MTITAESFAGLVLAVFSRRSPGFRPPLKRSGLRVPDSPATPPPTPVPDVPSPRGTPQASTTQDAVTGPSLADVTARWKSAPPRQRLQHRGNLLAVAAFLQPVVGARDLNLASDLSGALALDLARASAHALDLDLTLALDLAPARNRARDLVHALDRARDLDLALALARDLGDDLDRARNLALAFAFDRARDLDAARATRLVPAVDLALARALALEVALALDLARARTLAHTVALDGALDRDSDRERALDRALARVLAHALIEAHDNLTEAANNFVGADLTNLQPGEVTVVGIRWNDSTRWPTSEWTARMRSASEEDPPGSGVFVVLPEEGHHYTDSGSLAPIS